MVVLWHCNIFFHLILFVAGSWNISFDPRLEEFVWFETDLKDSHQPQPGDCCSGLQNLKEEY